MREEGTSEVTQPDAEPVGPSDNRPREEDGEQDVSQDPELDYSVDEDPR